MRPNLLVALAALAAASASGCLQPVQERELKRPCSQDYDCQQPAPDRCAPREAVCRDGACVEQPLPTLWADDPRACLIAADCECQSLEHPDCDGAWACVKGRCSFRCEGTTPCGSDGQCAAGEVCEPGPDCQGDRRCVPGCRSDEACEGGQVCAQFQHCKTCPCPKTCGEPEGCAEDGDCPPGAVCEPGADCKTDKRCVPGCRDSTACQPGEVCAPFVACESCPCPKTCGKFTGCKADEECPKGSVCEKQPGEDQPTCRSGCRTDLNCPAGEVCDLTAPCPECEGCVCLGQCRPKAKPCQSDLECPQTQICGFTDSCERACVPGCRSDSECGPGSACQSLPCDACSCDNRRCVPTGGCKTSDECAPGYVCGEDAQCGRSCVPGCRSDAECKPGERCAENPACSACGCGTPRCTAQAAACTDDLECGFGRVCEAGPGCLDDFRCVEGCHRDSQCGKGQVCVLELSCLTCPCPGRCEANPCVDGDRDGFAATCTASCPGLKTCDCDDRNAGVFPGAKERCGNKLDDNCDGQVDENCGCQGGPRCRQATECAWGQTSCVNGCCEACRMAPEPDCPPDSCRYPGGIGPDGCPLPGVCKPCCSSTGSPVCGANYSTYQSACAAIQAGTQVLHEGACQAFEGAACGWGGGLKQCPRGQYCRDDCPMCDAIRLFCTASGYCLNELDCPAGMPQPTCSDGSIPQVRCVKPSPETGGKCEYQCP